MHLARVFASIRFYKFSHIYTDILFGVYSAEIPIIYKCSKFQYHPKFDSTLTFSKLGVKHWATKMWICLIISTNIYIVGDNREDVLHLGVWQGWEYDSFYGEEILSGEASAWTRVRGIHYYALHAQSFWSLVEDIHDSSSIMIWARKMTTPLTVTSVPNF
jgi:hypothetical protein